MNIFADISLFSALVLFLLGTIVYRKNPNNQASILFLILCLSQALRGYFDYQLRIAPSALDAELWLHYCIIWVFSVSVILHFIFIFTERYSVVKKKRTMILLYGPALFFYLIDLPTGNITGIPVQTIWGWEAQIPPSIISHMCSIWSVGVVVVVLWLCFDYHRKAKESAKRKRTWYFFVGIFAGSFSSIISVLILPSLGISAPSFVMPSYLLACGIIGYGILKHKLLILTSDTAAGTILETMPDIILLVNVSQRIEQINQSAIRLLEYSELELIGMTVTTVLPSFAQELEKVQQQKLGHDSPGGSIVRDHVETVLVTKTGRQIPVVLSVSLITDESKEVLGTVCIAQDFSEHKKAKEGLLLSEGRYRGLIENAPLGIMTVDKDGYIQDINQELLKILGSISLADIQGLHVNDVARFRESGLVDAIMQCRDTGQNSVAESQSDLQGKIMHCKHYMTPIRDADEMVVGVQAIVEDITTMVEQAEALRQAALELENRVTERTTQLEQANEELADEKERLSVTLHSISEGVVTTDRVGAIQLMNSSAEKLCGMATADVRGKPFSEVFRLTREGPAVMQVDPVHDVIVHDMAITHSAETLLEIDGGNRKLIAFSAAPIRDITKKMRGVVVVIRDITATKNMEEQLFQARKLESIGQLASGIANDFNVLLSSVITNLFAAKMHVNPQSEMYAFFQEAEKSAFDASSLIKQLVSFSETESMVTTPQSIRVLIEDSIGFLLQSQKVDYRLQFSKKLKKVIIDRGLIDQVLSVLVNHAEQRMLPRGGTITFYAENVVITPSDPIPLEPGEYVKIAVHDYGYNISPYHMSRMFDPYFSIKENATGIGLSLAYAIIRRHKGHITISSGKEEGTSVVFYLPATLDEDTENIEESEQPTETSEKNTKVLFMDDDTVIRSAVSSLLVNMGYSVEVCTEGNQAIALYKKALSEEAPFDVVVMDLHIPEGMDGKTTMHELRAIDPQVKGIISSGLFKELSQKEIKNLGFCAIIEKPYKIEDLDNVITRVLQKKK